MNDAKAHKALTLLHAELTGRLERLADSVGRSEPLAKDSGEQAVELENTEVKDELQREAQAQLILVDRALQRIKDDHYGICIDCDKAVPETRLEAIPQAERCVKCESAVEA